MRNMTANILLSRAANYIEKNGLTKDQFVCTRGNRTPVCAAGALIAAKYGTVAVDNLADGFQGSQFRNVIVKSALRKVGKVLGDKTLTFDGLADWNDRASTTKKTVVNTFRKAIKVK